MTASDLPASRVPTTPDPIPPDARAELDLLDGEKVLRSWRTGFGFLVMTNLRCVHVWKKPELFLRSDWHIGPTFFFYNLAPTHVVASRFLELSEEQDVSVGRARFLVQDPQQVGREIDEAQAAGRAEWDARRNRVQQMLHRPRTAPTSPGATVIVREVVKVRCGFCGNLMDAGDSNCPSCGAPQK